MMRSLQRYRERLSARVLSKTTLREELLESIGRLRRSLGPRRKSVDLPEGCVTAEGPCGTA
jgi:hypothetical protein